MVRLHAGLPETSPSGHFSSELCRCRGQRAGVFIRFGHDTDYITKLPCSDVSEALVGTLRRHRVGVNNIVRW